MKKTLISLIVPCYNVEKVCDKFFQSLLGQTYSHIQLILVNDGSTDSTELKLFSYKEPLETKGYIFEYVYQENKGLGGAINTGLKRVKGEYLCWADPDDYYENNAFEVRLEYFRGNSDCNILTCDAYVRRAEAQEKYTLIGDSYAEKYKKRQFELLLDGRSVFCCGCHMVKVAALKTVNPLMDIYQARHGQNWQLLLPVYFQYDRHYLNLPLYNYIQYKNSMSHGDNTKEKTLKRYEEHEELLNETLKRIEDTLACDMYKYYSFVKDKYLKLKLITALEYRDKELFEKSYIEKQKTVGLDSQDKYFRIRMKYNIVNRLHILLKKLTKRGGV